MARSSTPTATASGASPAMAQRWRKSTIMRSCRSPIAGTARRKSAGASAISPSVFGARRKACGWRRPPSTSKHWSYWPHQDIRFVILAPHQAAKVRAIGERQWKAINGDAIDPSRAYRQAAALRPRHRAIFLRRSDRPRGRLRRRAIPRRPFRRQTHGRLCRWPRLAAAGPYRHRWRKLWPSSSVWRHGAGLRTGSRSKPNSWRA